jgi:hypothetical protein
MTIMGTLILMPSAAMAAGGHKAGARPAVANVNVQSADTVTPAAACAIWRGSHRGYGICGWTYFDYRWPNGRWQTFVVGTDYAVWTIWQRWPGDTQWSSGWHSLGGKATSGVSLRTYSPLTISVRGTDFRIWCKRWTGSQWVGWYRC